MNVHAVAATPVGKRLDTGQLAMALLDSVTVPALNEFVLVGDLALKRAEVAPDTTRNTASTDIMKPPAPTRRFFVDGDRRSLTALRDTKTSTGGRARWRPWEGACAGRRPLSTTFVPIPDRPLR